LRPIVRRTRGVPQGPIRRLFNPNDLGDLIKPFVLLDYFDIIPDGVTGLGTAVKHPHEVFGGGNHLELDRAREEIVQRLFAHQS
jgi:hypothetical protein